MEHLSGHHRSTVEQIFGHPTSGNIEWKKVLSLLEAVGTVTEEHNGEFKVELGPETETLHKPNSKDIDEQMIGDLRRMLTQAGLNPDGSPEVADEMDRDHGDNRWGKPTAD